jgi:hypothetical protein
MDFEANGAAPILNCALAQAKEGENPESRSQNPELTEDVHQAILNSEFCLLTSQLFSVTEVAPQDT